MSNFLSKAGERFKLDLKKVARHRLPHYLKLQQKTQPKFIRPSVPYDLHQDGSIPTEFSKLKYLVGDRVIIIKGPKTGNICKVSRHAEYGAYVLDENGPTNTVVVPKQFWTEGQTSHVVTFPRAVTEDQIRLVADIENENGVTKTVAVSNVEFNGSYYDEDYKKVVPYRTVFGQPDLVIPWPRPEPKEDGPLSTKIEDVKERSFFVESVIRDIIPEEALLTIRNPKSRHRKGELTKTEVRRLTPPKMPLTETKKAYYKERSELKKLNKFNLTDEMKEFLGAKIRENEELKAKKLQELRESR